MAATAARMAGSTDDGSTGDLALLLAAGYRHPALKGTDRAAPRRAAAPPVEEAIVLAGGGTTGFAAEAESLDFTLVACGVRPLLLEHGPEQALLRLADHARARGLTALFGPYEFEVDSDARRFGYSNRAGPPRPARPGSGAWRTLLIGPDPALAELAWIALATGWDQLLGQLLGYPACCAKFFEQRWGEAWSNFAGDPGSLLLAARADPMQALPWRANIFARYLAPCLVAHFPCRFDCPATLTLARRAEAALARFRPDLAKAARAGMRQLVFEDVEGLLLLPPTALRAADDGWALVPPAGATQRLHDIRVTRDGVRRGGIPCAARFAAFTLDETRAEAA